VSVEGISLTIAKLNEADFEIAVIPKTWELTNLSTLNPGDEVNLEADVIAKYVERIMQIGNSTSSVTIETLKNHGFA
jgi:riboflavin synthase